MKKMQYLAILISASMLLGCGGTSDSSTSAETSAQADAADAAGETAAETSAAAAESISLSASELFSDRDFEVGYDENNSAVIMLEGNTASCSSNAVQISEGTVTITDEGTYILSGSLENGMIIVNADKKDKIQLVLDNAEIQSETSAAIYVLQADKVFLTTTTDSKNTLTNGGSFVAIDDNNIDAVIYSKEDLTLNGSGTLTVTSPAGHGIVSKDSLTITSGTYEISSASHGLSGKDDICIADGSFTIIAGKDAIHAENADDASLGYVYIQSGDFFLTAEGDGISAAAVMQIENGSYQIVSGGGSENAEAKSSDNWGSFMGGGKQKGGMGMQDPGKGMNGEDGSAMPDKSEMPTDENGKPDMSDMPTDENGKPDMSEMPADKNGMHQMEEMSTDENGKPDMGEMPEGGNAMPDMSEMPVGANGSMEKPANSMDVEVAEGDNGEGTGTAASDDSSSMKGIKAGGNLMINGGSFTINSADDGVHSNASITIAGGSFEIAAGDDGFHADETLSVSDGSIQISESYEGLEGLHVNISGGSIALTASDDGLNAAGGSDESGAGGRDGRFGGGMSFGSSNGSIVISGGDISITANGDGMDANGSLEISGGNIYVTGPTQGDTSVLDYDSTGTITGGTFMGSGASSMSQTFSSYEQGVIAAKISNQDAGTEIQVKDSDGKVLLSYTPTLGYDYILISSPELQVGETYTVTAGTVTAEYSAG